MKRRNYINRYHNSRRYRSLLPAALLLIVIGLWLVCYDTYHDIRSRYAFKSYSEAPAFLGSYDPSPGRSFHPDQSQASGISTLKQALPEYKAQQLYTSRPNPGELFGELSIPKLNLTLPIYEGTGTDELDLGVGHYTGSVLPGEKDNCVLSGHRNTIFRGLDELVTGDVLFVTTDAGQFQYVVDKVRIVDKDDRTVIVPRPRATLTVTTCYPFVYIGAAPKRFILEAHLTME